MIFSDQAVEKVEDDLLGRKRLAERIALDIIGWKPDDSLVIGLYARWGDGKTSVINFIKDLYKSPEKISGNFDREKIPTIIEFNPWIFSNQGSLTQSFLLEVGKELGQRNSDIDKEIAKKIGLVRLYLEPVRDLGGALTIWISRGLLGMFGIAVATLLNQAFSNIWIFGGIIVISILIQIATFSHNFLSLWEKFYNSKAELEAKTLNQLKTDIKSKLAERERKILFIIDDVDRLTPEEVKTLFQLIKINLDLPNLIYLIAMDFKTVSEMISEKGIDGAEYIEKIIQIPIILPKADDAKLSKFLFKQLDEILKFFSEDKWDQERWGELYSAGLGKIFLKRGNLRIIKRPINQMGLSANLISSEVDPIDFLGIRTIEHFYPELYDYISRNKENFTTVNSHRDWQGSQLDKIKKEVQAELTKVDPFVEKVLFALFPPLRSIFENYSFGDERQIDWRKKRLICSSEYFDTYFNMDLPEGVIKESEMFSIIKIMGDYNAFTRCLRSELKTTNGEGFRSLLKTLLDYTDRFPTDKKSVSNILTALFDISDDATRIKAPAMFDFGAEMDLMRVVYFYLKNIRDKVNVAEVSKEAIKRTKSLYGAVNFLSINDPRREGAKKENNIMSEQDAINLAEECVKKIRRSAKNGSLRSNSELVYIIYRWKEWGDEKEVATFMEKFKKSKASLAQVVSKFVAITKRSSGSRVQEIPKVQFKSLQEFIDTDFIYEKLQTLKTAKLPKEQKEAVELFLKDYPKKDDPRY